MEIIYGFNIWESPPEWTTVIASIAMVVFLLKAFKVERRANEISSNKDRREIMPMFEIKDNMGIYYIKLNLLDNTALNIKVIAPEGILNLTNPQFYGLKKGGIYNIVFNDKVMDLTTDSIILSFQDVDGRKYEQLITDFDTLSTISFPKQIK